MVGIITESNPSLKGLAEVKDKGPVKSLSKHQNRKRRPIQGGYETPFLGYAGVSLAQDSQLESAESFRQSGLFYDVPPPDQLGGIGSFIVPENSNPSELTLPPVEWWSNCFLCQNPLFLLVQCNTTREPAPPRMLYIYACNSSECSSDPSSWRVFRGNYIPPLDYGNRIEQKELKKSIVKPSSRPDISRNTDRSSSSIANDIPTFGDFNTNSSFSTPPFADMDDLNALLARRNDQYSCPTNQKVVPPTNDVALNERDLCDQMLNVLSLTGCQSPNSLGAGKVPLKCFQPEPCVGFPSFALEFEEVSETEFTLAKKSSTSSVCLQKELAFLEQYNISHGLGKSSVSIPKKPVISGKSEDWEPEQYEKSTNSVPKLLKRFIKVVDSAPQQCIRYHRGGQPIPYNQLFSTTVPRCENCGAPRVFELQLMPYLLQVLQVEQHVIADQKRDGEPTSKVNHEAGKLGLILDSLLSEGLDYGTFAVFTCSENCSSSPTQAPFVEYSLEYGVVQVDDMKCI